jgi:hypothetical protein
MQLSEGAPTGRGHQQHEGRDAVIGEQILFALGQPDDLHRVQVRRLWGNRYRVNVYTGADATLARVANSYFVIADDAGDIVETTPRIVRQYGGPARDSGASADLAPRDARS